MPRRPLLGCTVLGCALGRTPSAQPVGIERNSSAKSFWYRHTRTRSINATVQPRQHGTQQWCSKSTYILHGKYSTFKWPTDAADVEWTESAAARGACRLRAHQGCALQRLVVLPTNCAPSQVWHPHESVSCLVFLSRHSHALLRRGHSPKTIGLAMSTAINPHPRRTLRQKVRCCLELEVVSLSCGETKRLDLDLTLIDLT